MANFKIFAFIIAAFTAHAQSAYDQSNCRVISSRLKEADGTPFARFHELIDYKDKERLPGAAGDLQEEECKRDLAIDVIRWVVDPNTKLTRIADDGFMEFSLPGRKGEFTRCRYHVDANVPVSDVMLQYDGLKKGPITNFYEYLKQLSDEGKRIVKTECDAVS